MKMKMKTNWFAGTIALVVMLGISSTAVADYVSAVLGDDPIAYWRFEDGNLGDKLIGQTATDSADSHHGTYSVEGSCDGVELVAGVPGIGGLAGSFAGTNDSNGEYVQYDTLGSFGSDIGDNGATFEFWYKDMGTSTTSTRLFGVSNEKPGAIYKTMLIFTLHRSTVGEQEFYVRHEDDGIQEIEFDGSVRDIHDGDWHHVALVIETSGAGVPLNGLNAYVDGVLMTPTSQDGDPVMDNFADLDKDFTVGCYHNRSNYYHSGHLQDGVIDEFAVYSKALTQTEIQAHIDAVPEPSTLVLLGMGLVGLLCYAWRKRK